VKKIIQEKLSVFNKNFELSNPFEFDWINKLKKQEKKVSIIGNGVTANEVSIICKKNNIGTEKLCPKKFLKNNISKEKLYILACPSLHYQIIKRFKEKNNLIHLSFISFKNILRNRIVFDLGSGSVKIKKYKVLSLINKYSLIPSVCGVDFLSDCYDNLIAVGKILKHVKNLHKRAVLHCYKGLLKIPQKNLEGFNVMEIKIENNTNINHKQIANIISKNKKFFKKVQIFTSNKKLVKKIKAPNIFYEKKFPKYYDEFINLKNKEASTGEIKTLPGKMCLSRRMFPIFDKNLRLKCCSLYKKVLPPSYRLITSKTFIEARKKLCEKCIKNKFHRLF
jgi:hypothetical protein